MSFANVDWAFAVGVIITGLVVVFFVLAFLWFAVSVIGVVVNKIARPKTQADLPVMETTKVATQPLTQEVIAAITAAVAMVVPSNFKIERISLQGQQKPLWINDDKTV